MREMTRKECVARLLLDYPHGITEGDIIKAYHFLNGRNEANRIEQLLGISLQRTTVEGITGSRYTRYAISNKEDARKVLRYSNQLTAKRKGTPIHESTLSKFY